MIAILSVVIGGLRIEGGPIVGTIIVVIFHFWLARYAVLSLLIQGIILIVVMLAAPQGIVGYLRKTRAYLSLQRFVVRR